jgi:hypothetical protein
MKSKGEQHMLGTEDRSRGIFSIDGSMFKRSGAWFGLFQRGSSYGDISLYLGTCHGIAAKAPDKNRLIEVSPAYEGRKVPFTVETQPAELTLRTRHGNVRFTFADMTKLLAEGDPGMGLVFEKTMVKHETVHPRKNGAWEAVFRLSSSFIFQGLNGSAFDFNDGKNPWNWENLSSDKVRGCTHPGPDGRFTLVLEEFQYGGIVRSAYPSYAEAKASMQADWDAFYAGMPGFSEPFEERRAQCQYTLWSYLTSPYGLARYPMIQMFAGIMGSQWQMCQNAVALQEHTELAVDLLLGPLDRISPEGQLADGYDDASCETQIIKPPIHGWAILQIMKHHDLKKECSREKLELLYRGIGAWGDWFMTFRDEDEDGLPSLVHGDETGLDDSTMFLEHMVVTSPDLCAYLVLLFEAVGDLGKLLDKPEAECAAWYEKSSGLLRRMLEKLWDGAHFTGIVPGTGERIFSGSIVHYMPAILGNRLPGDIIDKLADDLCDTDQFFSPWGLASEDMTSDWFCPSPGSIGRGCVVPPAMIYICTGLWETKRRDTARSFAERYCSALQNSNFPFLINPKNGIGSGYFGGSWPRCAYTILGRLISEE